jgi:hypothetical protein
MKSFVFKMKIKFLLRLSQVEKSKQRYGWQKGQRKKRWFYLPIFGGFMF